MGPKFGAQYGNKLGFQLGPMSITKLSPNWACQMGPIHFINFLLSGMALLRISYCCHVKSKVSEQAYYYNTLKTFFTSIVSGHHANPVQVNVFLLQVFPDIIHPDLHLPPISAYSLPPRVRVNPRLVVFLPPSALYVQATEVSFS